MGSSTISLGLGLGGGKAATSSGRLAGGGAFTNQYSVSLDGTDDYVSTSSFDLTTNKTVSFWIKLNSISSAGVYLFGNGGSYYSYITSNGRTMYKYNGSVAKSISISAANAISTGSWQHIVITGDGSSSVLYKNGTSIGTGVDITPLGLNRFGGDSVGGSRFIDGLMDEVAVWDATLSADDVTAIYNSGVPNDLSSASSYDTDRTSNLVHWWRMGDINGASGVTITDQGSGGNNGTLTNGPTYSRSVPYNYFSLSLDGTNDYIDCGGASDFSFNNGSGTDSAFSISAWVKFDNTDRARAVSKDNGTGSREYLFGTNNTNKVNMILGDGSNNLDIRNNATINTSDWFHIVATYDGSKSISGLKVYVNADASSLSDVSVGTYAGMPLSTGNLDIGRFANGHSFFNGLVDEVAVFSKELTALDVTNIYNTGFPNDIGTNGLNLDPLAWWRMGDNDSGSGTTVTDQGSGGNNGSLNNIASPNGFVTDVP